MISQRAADTSVALLRQVVTNGTARTANVEGYEIAGKTGTADKPRPGGGYYDKKNVTTFASVFPASDPKYVLVVTLDEPTARNVNGVETRTAGTTTVPVAAELIRRIAPLLGLRPQTEQELPVIEPRHGDAVRLVSN